MPQPVTPQLIASLGDRPAITAFFGTLGYDVSKPEELTAASLGIPERIQHMVSQIWRIAAESAEPGQAAALEIYWVEATSITADLRKNLANIVRNRFANALLVVTPKDFRELHLVLPIKSVAEGVTGAGVTVAHRWLALDRRRPMTTHLRALNRMGRARTAAGAKLDPYAQFDRLKDAFDLAEWSTPEFNNRNLFSDYFLQSRLTQPGVFAEWSTDLRPGLKQIQQVVDGDGGAILSTPTDYRQKFLDSFLRALGFEPQPVSDASEGQADYILHATGTKKPLAGLLAYRWDRPLDRPDDSPEAPCADDIPGIRVVNVLEQQKLPWAMVTNGKIWRLYCAAAHSRATNYYEIDLPVALEQAAQGDVAAFRYFYLFFRAAAFAAPATPASTLCFLDQLRLGSAAYAKELGERLREHIFDTVFPYLAQGFVDYRKAELDQTTKADDPFLAEVYDATLVLLYRLLFLLYAESLDLLPVGEPAYRSISLHALKEEVAAAAGPAPDAVETHLKDEYNRSDTRLYKRLAKLFAVIAGGDKDHNVPTYNGGLFSSDFDKANTTREAKAARFLAKFRVPDFYLARALDLLARGEDTKSHDLVFIDYKSLGVRHLGSVYEGLLMYHVVLPREDWEKEYQQPGLKIALVPSNKERKSTGSYFTPLHIVEHIVHHTVGPLLEEKFTALAPKFREAQRKYADSMAYEKAKPNHVLSRRRSDEHVARDVLREYEHVVHDLFDLKVLDPAMGSAHFLVETVDYITDKVLTFLAGFPWNPVHVFVEHRVRRPILDALDEQGIKVNENRLTDVNLIKRLVMKRCVYGVDLNPMAVELAKVSLWLDSFTIGAPLTFLDHHLKCGNSLIGSTIERLKALVEGQGTLWSIPTEPLLRATRNMEMIADLTDATLTEAKKSADTYRQVLAGVEGYRALLDCLTVAHFGVPDAPSLVSEGADLDLTDWKASVQKLPRRERGWIDKADEASRARRFLHWDVDFPDVFYTTTRPEAARFFDAVVGNPPYDELSEDEAEAELPEKEYLDTHSEHQDAQGGRQNLFRFFVLRAMALLRPGGRHGFIVPLAIIADQFSRKLRLRLFQIGAFEAIEAFPQKDDPRRRVFEEAKLPTVLYIISKLSQTKSFLVRTNPAQYVDGSAKAFHCDARILRGLDPENMMIPLLGEADWAVLQRIALNEKVQRLQDVAKPCSGEIVFNDAFRKYLTPKPTGTVILRGGNVQRYAIIPEPKQGEPVYLHKDAFLRDKKEGSSYASGQARPRN